MTPGFTLHSVECSGGYELTWVAGGEKGEGEEHLSSPWSVQETGTSTSGCTAIDRIKIRAVSLPLMSCSESKEVSHTELFRQISEHHPQCHALTKNRSGITDGIKFSSCYKVCQSSTGVRASRMTSVDRVCPCYNVNRHVPRRYRATE